jgi:hypothetical protein
MPNENFLSLSLLSIWQKFIFTQLLLMMMMAVVVVVV